MSVTDIKALQKWSKIPKDIQEKLIDNVFCTNCHVTTIVDYSLHDDQLGIVLRGKCKKCGKAVARVVES